MSLRRWRRGWRCVRGLSGGYTGWVTEQRRVRVLVTRAAGQASALAELLVERGFEPVMVPAIEIVAPESWCGLDAALTTLRAYDWVVFTSANAVRAFAERAKVLGLGANPRRVAVVGPATARAVEEVLGCEVDLMPGEFVAEALGEALVHALNESRGSFASVGHPASVLVVRAAVARDVLLEMLAAAGARVTVAEAYRNVIPGGSASALRRSFEEGGVDAITFTSGSTAVNLRGLLDAAGVEVPKGVVLASIGPVTSKAMREVGLEASVEAPESTIAGLVAGLERTLSRV
jgi:uroporphyrinogen-III synthase